MIRRVLLSAVYATLLTSTALACPACSTNVEGDPNLPRAFMYSILFMLSMPPLILGGIGFAIWRAHRRHALAQAALELGDRPTS